MNKTDYCIIIEFRYGIEDNEPFYELATRFHERMESELAPGTYDGHEIAMDNFDARFYFYTDKPQKTLTYIDDLLKEYKFLIGARINIRQGMDKNGFTEVEIISQDGIRTPISRFDAEQLSSIPEWGDHSRHYTESEDGDEWKHQLKNERAEKLYNKWKEIDYLIEAIWDKRDLAFPDTLENESKNKEEDGDFLLPKEMIEWHRNEMRGNAHLIPVKISGAEAGDMYILRMENAAIIRKAAMDIYLDCHMLKEIDTDEQDIALLRAEINNCLKLFIEWVNGFEKDEFQDDWGLFV